MRSAIKFGARLVGYEIRRADGSSTMRGALRRAASAHQIGTVIDIGASDGRWSAMAQEFFPDVRYLLIEAQADPHAAALEESARRNPRLQVVLAAAGDRPGEIHFDASDPFGGAAADKPFDTGDMVVRMTTVDAEIDRLALPRPFLLKLDTHGFEQEVLRGASVTLAETSVLIIESYNFELRPGALRFHELCAYLDGVGFRPSDLVDILRRPSDEILWQFDLVFGRSGADEFRSDSYGAPARDP